MSLVTLRYDVSTGVRRALDMLAPVAAIQLQRGELDLLGMEVIEDTVDLLTPTSVARVVTLQTTLTGSVNFPTVQALQSATLGLYRSVLNLAVPGAVVQNDPRAVTFDPQDIARLSYWWRADINVGYDQETKLIEGGWAPIVEAGPVILESTGDPPLHVLQQVNLDNQQSVFFPPTGALLVSNAVAGTFRFLHNGSGSTVVAVFRPTNAAALQTLISDTAVGGIGIGFNLAYDGTAGNFIFRVGNGAAQIINSTSAAGGAPLNQNSWVAVRYQEGRPGNEWSILVNGVEVTGNSGGAPSGAPEAANLRIGNSVGDTDPILGAQLPEIIMWDVYVTDAELTQLFEEYLAPWYGSFA